MVDPSKQTDLNRPIAAFVQPAETVIRADQTVQEALDTLRGRKIQNKVIYFYVVDEAERLVGIVPTRALLLAQPGATVRSIMRTGMVTVSPETTLEEALEVFAVHRLWALPVVDDEGGMLGIVDAQVYVEEMFEFAEAARMADLHQLIGMTAELRRHGSPWAGLRLRLPWLTFNLAGGLGCAAIAWLFEAALAQVLLLAMFIPLVLTLSESISMQSMTLSLQMLHGRKVPWRMVRKRLALEWPTAVLLGVACAVVVGLVALLWGPTWATVGTLIVSVTLAMVAAATVGVLLPAALHAAKLDPKLAAGPLVLMVGDIVAMAIYLGLATWWLL